MSFIELSEGKEYEWLNKKISCTITIPRKTRNMKCDEITLNVWNVYWNAKTAGVEIKYPYVKMWLLDRYNIDTFYCYQIWITFEQ